MQTTLIQQVQDKLSIYLNDIREKGQTIDKLQNNISELKKEVNRSKNLNKKLQTEKKGLQERNKGLLVEIEKLSQEKN